VESLNNHTRAECGYATVHDVLDKSLEDRQESFFLSETCKYLYLLFDVDNPINRHAERYLFTTEGHVFPIRADLRRKVWEEEDLFPAAVNASAATSSSCQNPVQGAKHSAMQLPLRSKYLEQVFSQFGVNVA
jgi:mannosidase alpha-like ER degradation enhancer 1